MFTGIINDYGAVAQIDRHQNSSKIKITTSLVKEINSKIGGSIAVNGVCLTITRIFTDGFQVDVMPETTKRTAFNRFRVGTKVNLEPALLPTDRIDGHFVLGHVDTTATLIKKVVDDNAIDFEFTIGNDFKQYIVEKGSIALDGVSLTIVKVIENHFIVSLIPHTIKETTFKYLKIGNQVNVETDILGKYILSKKRDFNG
ncbi:riboflavin synthase [Pediococcus acidilactici]|uniref:riboflavin synthase n=1 Tax=Pediococcus acidilactici TaxID=1254 RepID=UPI003009C0C0